MKNLHLLVWLTQLGLSTAVPLAGFVLLAVWLKNRFDLGLWVVLLGIGLGLFCAVDGFVRNLKVLNRLSKEKEKEDPPVSFGEHD
ncbi:MAG: AtpZ/AtpI family protein [Oscillospiraceae bacterium]|nr:AtpZ/AtpI family protein [Oscillospiraceae bacterium]MBQ7330157.1 AtpZ/AtpI family protein [Oscillospiraceae bacterium]